MHINSVFSILGQMGVGPKKGFAISGARSFFTDVRMLSVVSIDALLT